MARRIILRRAIFLLRAGIVLRRQRWHRAEAFKPMGDAEVGRAKR
jgi:hypothetical protein